MAPCSVSLLAITGAADAGRKPIRSPRCALPIHAHLGRGVDGECPRTVSRLPVSPSQGTAMLPQEVGKLKPARVSLPVVGGEPPPEPPRGVKEFPVGARRRRSGSGSGSGSRRTEPYLRFRGGCK